MSSVSGRYDSATHKVLLIQTPTLADAARIQSEAPMERQAGEVDGVPYVLAIQDVGDLPVRVRGWKIRLDKAVITKDAASLLTEARRREWVEVAYLLGRYLERTS